MEPWAWDITKAAAVHAALAGVLAGLTIALFAVLADRRGNNTPARHHVYRLLILATFLLLISAIIWGGLAGQPSVEVLARADPWIASPIRERTFVSGSAAVTLLAVGSLSLIGGLLEVVLASKSASSDEWRRFAAWSYAALAGLATYEVALFVNLAGLKLAGLARESVSNYVSLGLAVVIGVLGSPPLQRAPRASVKAQAWQIRWAVSAGALGIVAYAVNPTGSFYDNVEPTGFWDWFCVVAIASAALSAAGFMLTSARQFSALEGPQPPRAAQVISDVEGRHEGA